MDKMRELREAARSAIIETLKNGYTGYYYELHDEVFNPYTIGNYKAEDLVKDYDICEVIEKIQAYERKKLDEVLTDPSDPDSSDPKKLANMLFYVIGEEVLDEMTEGIELWNKIRFNQADEETNAEILKILENSRVNR